MTWEEQLFALFDDLEAQATTAFDEERTLEVADRAQGEYATVSLAARLMATVGQEVTVHLAGTGVTSGRLARVAKGWFLLESATQEWIVRIDAVHLVRGLAARAVPAEAWPVTAKLGLGSALRGLVDESCQVVLAHGARHEGRIVRVGEDFVEVLTGEPPEPVVLPFRGIVAVHSGR